METDKFSKYIIMITKYKKGQSPEVNNGKQNKDIIKRTKNKKISHKKKKTCRSKKRLSLKTTKKQKGGVRQFITNNLGSLFGRTSTPSLANVVSSVSGTTGNIANKAADLAFNAAWNAEKIAKSPLSKTAINTVSNLTNSVSKVLNKDSLIYDVAKFGRQINSNNILGELYNLNQSMNKDSLLKAVSSLPQGFSTNLNSDLSDFRTGIPKIFNKIIKPSLNSSYYVIKAPSKFIYNGLYDTITSNKLVSIGMAAGIISLGALYWYSQESEDQIEIQKKKKIISSKKDEFIRLDDLQLYSNNVEYYDEALLSMMDNDPYYSYRQIIPERKEELMKIIYETLQEIGDKKDIIGKVDKIKKIRKLIIFLKKTPYLLKEKTNICFSKVYSDFGGVPLLFCIFHKTDDLRVIKLLLDIYNKSTLKIHENEKLIDQLRTQKYNFTVLDYLLTQKINENSTFKKVNWVLSNVMHSSVSYHTVFLYLKYIREFYRMRIFSLKRNKSKKFTIVDFKSQKNETVESFDFFYKKLKYIRYILINGLLILLRKYFQNLNKSFNVNLFDSFIEILTLEKNLIPLDIQIIECLIMSNIEININNKNKDKYQKLLHLESRLDNQNNEGVIRNFKEKNEVIEDKGLSYGQITIRENSERLVNLNDRPFPLEINSSETNGIHCSLKSNIFYHIKKYQKNSQEKGITPYLLFPINEEEMKFTYVNIINCNHSYSKALISKKPNKIARSSDDKTFKDYMLKENLTCTRVFLTLEAAVRDFHYYQVYFLNRPFKIKLENNFVVFVKKTKKSYVKISINLPFIETSLVKQRYEFWVQRSDIDFFMNSNYRDQAITGENTGKQHLQITKERVILIKDIKEEYTGRIPFLNNFFKKKICYSYCYKDINIINTKTIDLEFINNKDYLMLLIFKNLNNPNKLKSNISDLIRNKILDSNFIRHIDDKNIINFSKNNDIYYTYLDNGNYILLKDNFGDIDLFFSDIIIKFLNSRGKKHLIIPFSNANRINFNSFIGILKDSIDKHYSTNFNQILDSLSKTIIILEQSTFSAGKDIKMEKIFSGNENRDVYPYANLYIDNVLNSIKDPSTNTKNKISLHDKYYHIYDIILPEIKKLIPGFDVNYNHSTFTLSITNNTQVIYDIRDTLLEHFRDIGTCYKYINNRYNSEDYETSKIKDGETLYFFLGENFLNKPEKSSPKYLAFSSTTITGE